MPYKTIDDLPDKIKDKLPKHAQKIYLEAFNHAESEYKSKSKRRDPGDKLEVIAHKVAWAAVKKKYTKSEGVNKWKKI